MLNISPVGRNCSQEERDAFEQYDNVSVSLLGIYVPYVAFPARSAADPVFRIFVASPTTRHQLFVPCSLQSSPSPLPRGPSGGQKYTKISTPLLFYVN